MVTRIFHKINLHRFSLTFHPCERRLLGHTVYPRSSYSFNKVSYYIKWALLLGQTVSHPLAMHRSWQVSLSLLFEELPKFLPFSLFVSVKTGVEPCVPLLRAEGVVLLLKDNLP